MTNSAAYDAALRQRGSLIVWFNDAAIAAWKAEPRTTRGGQPRYLALAIATALTLCAVFRLALRQTEGLIGSVLGVTSRFAQNCTLGEMGHDIGPFHKRSITEAMGRSRNYCQSALHKPLSQTR